MGKGDEKRHLIAGCFLVLLVIALINVWLLAERERLDALVDLSSVEMDVNTLAPTGGGLQSSGEGTEEKQLEKLPAIAVEMADEIRERSKYQPEKFTEIVNKDGSITVQTNGYWTTTTAGAVGSDGKLTIRHGEEFLKNVKEK